MEETKQGMNVNNAYSDDDVTNTCNLQFDTGHPSFTFQAAVFDGSGSTFVDQDISLDLAGMDITIAMNVYPYDQSPGVIFHYKYTGSPNPTHVTELKLSKDSAETLHVLCQLDTGASCGSLVLPNALPPLTWSWILVSRISSSGNLNANFRRSGLNFGSSVSGPYTDVSLMTPGILRIGASLTPTDADFTGKMSCVTFWFTEETADAYTESESNNMCETSQWSLTPTGN
jgi:hypothetical protein